MPGVFFLSNCYLSSSFNSIWSKSSVHFWTASGKANIVSCVGLQNKTGHSARHKGLTAGSRVLSPWNMKGLHNTYNWWKMWVGEVAYICMVCIVTVDLTYRVLTLHVLSCRLTALECCVFLNCDTFTLFFFSLSLLLSSVSPSYNRRGFIYLVWLCSL